MATLWDCTYHKQPPELAIFIRKPYDLPMPNVAILTGDLIASSSAGPDAVDRTLSWISELLRDGERPYRIAHVRFTRFRGDGWQAMIDPAPHYLRVLTGLLSGLPLTDAPLATRIGIGIGTVTRTGSADLSDAAGSALTASGRALDGLAAADRIAVAGLPAPRLACAEAGLETLAWLSARWSREQAEALHARLVAPNLPLARLAGTLGISRQALSARLAVAGEKPLMAAIRAAEAEVTP
jgi:hypothetical protein